MIDTAYDMGISKDRKLPDVASIGLGAGEVTPLDMATAYAPLSNGGLPRGASGDLQDRHPGRHGGGLRSQSGRGSSRTASPTR